MQHAGWPTLHTAGVCLAAAGGTSLQESAALGLPAALPQSLPHPKPKLSIKVGGQWVTTHRSPGEQTRAGPVSTLSHPAVADMAAAATAARQSSDQSDLHAMEGQTRLHSLAAGSSTAASSLSEALSQMLHSAQNAETSQSHESARGLHSHSTQKPSSAQLHTCEASASAHQQLQPDSQQASLQRQQLPLHGQHLQPHGHQYPQLQRPMDESGLPGTTSGAGAESISGYYKMTKGAVRGLLLALELPHKQHVAVYKPATGPAAKTLPLSQLHAR